MNLGSVGIPHEFVFNFLLPRQQLAWTAQASNALARPSQESVRKANSLWKLSRVIMFYPVDI